MQSTPWRRTSMPEWSLGNPDDPASHFATICKPGSGWAVKKISALDTPAYTSEKVPEELLPLLVSPEWVERGVHGFSLFRHGVRPANDD